MGYQKKLIRLLCCLGCMAAIETGNLFFLPDECVQVVQAAESSVIEKIDVVVKSAWGDAEEILVPEIQVSGAGISLVDVQFGTEPEIWKPGKKVRLEINVAAEAGKYVPAKMGSSKCRVKGASFVSARALDDNTLQIKADYLPVSVLGVPQEAGWSSRIPGKAVWKRVSNAPGYALTLYGNDKVVKRMTVTGGSAELGEFMKDPDRYYYYEVKAVPITDTQKKYLKEGDMVVSREVSLDELDLEEASAEQSVGEDTGSFKGDYYIYPDGSKAVSAWKKIHGNWYHFREDGSRSTGWLSYGGRWYYMDSSGIMQTGWVFPGDGFWYYLNPDGDMAVGWVQPTPGSWYYLNPDGKMHTGWLLLNGVWYYLNPDGKMHTGWKLLDGSWYYMNAGGDMAVNVVKDGWRIGADGIGRKE